MGKRSAGFSLLQLSGTVAVLLSLSFVAPVWWAVRVNRSRVAQAERDAAAIADGLRRFEMDHGFPLIRRHPPDANSIDFLVGPGEAPILREFAGWATGKTDNLINYFALKSFAGAIRPDPWQNRYMVNVGVVSEQHAGEDVRYEIFVLSAGPNGIVETPFRQPQGDAKAAGDDIVVRVR